VLSCLSMTMSVHVPWGGVVHPTEHAPTWHVHYIVIDKQDNTCYMLGSLPSAHTPNDFV